MPIARLLHYSVDLHSHTLAYHSFTDLLTLLTTNHVLHCTFSNPRLRATVLLLACRLLPSQRSALTELAEADVKALLVMLSGVERRLLNGRTIAPLHLSLLVQSLLSTSFSSASSSLAASLQSLVPTALSPTAPFLSRFFSPPPAAANAAATTATTPTDSFPRCPSLDSLKQPHLSLWLRNPFESCGFLTEWAAQHKPQRANASSPAAALLHVSAIRDTLDGRIVWLGSWRDERHSLCCFGLYFGTVDRARDGQHRFDLRQLPMTSVEECQRRMSDPTVLWDELPVVSFDLAWSTDNVTADSMPSLLYFPSLTAFLLSVSSFTTSNAAAGLRSLLCAPRAQQAQEEEEEVVSEALVSCGKHWRWWAGCLVGECGRHMLPSIEAS